MNSVAEQLFKTIQESRQHLDALARLSDAELEAIKTRDFETLQGLIKDKQHALLGFDQSVKARNQLLTQSGCSADKTGLDQLIQRCDPREQAALRQAWPKLEASLTHVSELNARNEQVVQRNKQSVDKLLSIIRGQNQRTTLYDQSGGSGHYAAQNIIGKA